MGLLPKRMTMYVALAVESHRLNLPKSMKTATEFAAMAVKHGPRSGGVEQRHIQAVVPLIVNDESSVTKIFASIGKEHALLDSVEEMKEALQTETFVSEYIVLSNLVRDVQTTLTFLQMNDIHVIQAGSSFVKG